MKIIATCLLTLAVLVWAVYHDKWGARKALRQIEALGDQARMQ